MVKGDKTYNFSQRLVELCTENGNLRSIRLRFVDCLVEESLLCDAVYGNSTDLVQSQQHSPLEVLTTEDCWQTVEDAHHHGVSLRIAVCPLLQPGQRLGDFVQLLDKSEWCYNIAYGVISSFISALVGMG